MTIQIKIPDGPVTEFLASEAEKKNCSPSQLAVALLSCAAQGRLTDAILDGSDPALIPELPRTSLQVRVLRALQAFKAPNGTMAVSFKDIAAYLGLNSRGPVATAIAALMEKGLIDQVSTGSQGVPSRYKTTAKGAELLKALAR